MVSHLPLFILAVSKEDAGAGIDDVDYEWLLWHTYLPRPACLRAVWHKWRCPAMSHPKNTVRCIPPCHSDPYQCAPWSFQPREDSGLQLMWSGRSASGELNKWINLTRINPGGFFSLQLTLALCSWTRIICSCSEHSQRGKSHKAAHVQFRAENSLLCQAHEWHQGGYEQRLGKMPSLFSLFRGRCRCSVADTD